LLTDQVRENVSSDRMISVLSALFAGLATALAAVGLYGVLAYVIGQRTKEIGVRMALGAAPSRIHGMILGNVGWMILIGGTVGIAAALAVGRLAESLLFRLKGYDPVVLGSAIVILALVGFLAGFIPARRASRIDPMVALRYE